MKTYLRWAFYGLLGTCVLGAALNMHFIEVVALAGAYMMAAGMGFLFMLGYVGTKKIIDE